jgi:adenylate cyclase
LAAHQEIERKFLVSAVPADAGEGTPVVQGYLPLAIDDIEVRVRRYGETPLLTVKGGQGVTRSEWEGQIGDDLFEALWPLTEGRRIEKTRYRVQDGDATIEVDEYRGRLAGLLVAEVEFDSQQAGERFDPPDWIGREVSGDPAYTNRALAERAAPLR